MKLSIQAGSTSQTVNVFVRDSSSATGAGLTGLVFNSSGLTAYYALPKAAAVSITLATLAAVTSAYSSGGFKEIDSTNMPGWYRFDVPDAALASGRFVSLHLKGVTNMAPLPVEIELTGWSNQDSVRGGMTAMPNATPGAAGGMFIAGSNAATTVNFTGNVSGSVGSVTADCGITQAAADKVFGGSGAALAELSGVPSATPTPRNALMLVYMAMRNKLTTTASTKTVFNDAGTSIGAKTLSDDGTTYTEAKMA